MLTATASRRVIEVQLEPLSEKATRVRAVVKNGMLFDSATATEIVLQTEKALDRAVAGKAG